METEDDQCEYVIRAQYVVSTHRNLVLIIKWSMENTWYVVSTHRKLMLITKVLSELERWRWLYQSIKDSPWASSLKCFFFLLSVALPYPGNLSLAPIFSYLVKSAYRVPVVLPWLWVLDYLTDFQSP